MRYLPTLILLTIFTLLMSHQSFASDTPDLTEAKKAAEAVNAFAFDMYAQLSKSNDKSICFSPYSISSAFGMLYAGASAEAEKEIKKVMHYGPDVHRSMLNLKNLLDASANPEPTLLQGSMRKYQAQPAQFTVANAVWPTVRLTLAPRYEELVKNFYGSEITKLDYKNKWKEAEEAINRWTEKNTRGKIPRIVPQNCLRPQRNQETVLVLTNALYFQSAWFYPFHASETKEETFHAINGNIKVKMMKKSFMGLQYVDNDQLQMLALPYRTKKHSMIIVVPRERLGIFSIEKNFSYDEFKKSFEQRKGGAQINLCLPKFETEYYQDLVPNFQSLGMKCVFSYSWDNFSALFAESKVLPQAVSNIFHKVSISVNEQGTTATAATAIIMSVLGDMREPEIIEFRADHPFLYFIVEHDSGAILFMGRYTGR